MTEHDRPTLPLAAERVTFNVGGIRLLDDVSFTVHGGTLTALVGPNGAGKSTMLSLLAGDRRPTSGTVRLGEASLTDWSIDALARERSVMVQQQNVQFAFTVAELVALGRMPYDADDERDAAIVAAAMEVADLSEFTDREVTTLSGGELARTVFARVLAQDAPVMLLDEPTAALDLRHSEMLMRVLRERAAAGCSALVVVHDLNIAARYADRVLMFSDGRLVADATAQEALIPERIEQVYGQRVSVLTHPESGVPLIVPVG